MEYTRHAVVIKIKVWEYSMVNFFLFVSFFFFYLLSLVVELFT